MKLSDEQHAITSMLFPDVVEKKGHKTEYGYFKEGYKAALKHDPLVKEMYDKVKTLQKRTLMSGEPVCEEATETIKKYDQLFEREK